MLPDQAPVGFVNSGPLRSYVPTGRIPTGAEVAANNVRRTYGHGTIDQIAAMLGARIYDSRNIRR